MATTAPSEATRSTILIDRLRTITTGTSALQMVALGCLFVVTSLTVSGFLTKTSLYSVLILSAFLGIAAAGQTIVILIGGIDLSVPSVIGAANLITPALGARHWSDALLIPFVLVCGGIFGAFNGLITRRLRLSPLIVTLATGTMITGGALAWTNNGFTAGAVPTWLSTFSSPIGKTFGIDVPPVLVIWAILAVALGLVLKRTVTGHHIYATGANERAAELAGIQPLKIWTGAFALSGVSAAAVGVLLTGFVGSASVGIGNNYLFTSLAAVLVGGTSLVGARGNYGRTVLGALILTLITTLLVGHGAGTAVQEIVFGVLIMVFVGLYGRDTRLRDRI